MIVAVLVGALMFACACILVAGGAIWIAREHALANRYRNMRKEAPEAAPPPPDQWTVSYRLDKKRRKHAVRAPSESQALMNFMTSGVRYDSIDDIERG